MTTARSEADPSTVARQPGRLGNPDSSLGTDPRADPRMVAAMREYGIDALAADPPVSPQDPMQARLDFIDAAEAGFTGLFDALVADLPPVPDIERTTESIVRADGSEITLYLHRPAGSRTDLPAMLHVHGGGMTLLSATAGAYVRWRDELAATGMLVVGVEFRNAAGINGPHPFPAGLEDCTSALAWLHGQRDRLRISSLIIGGESGGANLSLATVLKAKQDGTLNMVDGVYATCPFISGAYGWSDAQKLTELPSLLENDGYFVNCSLNAVIASLYDADGTHAQDPLCWPYWAEDEDLAGLPPHVITVDELDIFRDEGLAYHRKLARAGVQVHGRALTGMCHAGEVMFRKAVPDMYLAVIQDVHAFAAGLAGSPGRS